MQGGTGEVDHVYKVSSTRSFHRMMPSADGNEILGLVVLATQAVRWVAEFDIDLGRARLAGLVALGVRKAEKVRR